MKANRYEAILRSVGFNPATLAEMREKQWNERQIERAYADRRRRVYDRLRKYFLLPEDVRNDDHPDWISIMADVHEYNARVDRRGLGDTIPHITGQADHAGHRQADVHATEAGAGQGDQGEGGHRDPVTSASA